MSQSEIQAVYNAGSNGKCAPPNDTLVWSQIPSPRFVNVPFTVTIQAMTSGVVDTSFAGPVALMSTNGISVTPAVSANFSQGTWTGTVQVNQTVSNLVLQAADNFGHSATANPINVVALPVLTTGVSGNNFYLIWPDSPSGFLLDTAPDINGPWVRVNDSPVQIGDQYLQQFQMNGTNAFYRLRFPGP